MMRISKSRSLAVGLATIALLVSAVALVVHLDSVSTETSRVYIDPVSVAIGKDADVTAEVRIDSKEPIDTAMAKIVYDGAKLKYKDIIYDKTAFDSDMPVIVDDNSVMLQVAKLGGETVRNDLLIATVSFTGLRDGSTRLVLEDANAARAGVATKPRHVDSIKIQPIVWWLGATAVAFLAAAITMMMRNRKS